MYGVGIIVDGDKADIVIGKIAFGIISDLEIFTSETGEVLDDHGGDIAHFDIFQHLFKSRTVEIRAGEAVILINLDIAEVIFLGVVAQHFLLVCDGVALLIAAVITTETAVESGDVGHLFLLVGLFLVRLH